MKHSLLITFLYEGIQGSYLEHENMRNLGTFMIGKVCKETQNGSKFKKIVTFPYEGSNKVSHTSLGKGI